MRKLPILLAIAAFIVILTASSVLAAHLPVHNTDSYRSQATAAMMDDDPIDDLTNGVTVVDAHPKWVLMTRFSNLLGGASGGAFDSTGQSEDKILDYGSGSVNGSTFYALIGSSEWFETNLGMPVNFAFSYQRDGARLAMLENDTNPGDGNPVDASGAATNVYSSNGDGYSIGEHSDRRASADYKNNEWNLTGGYKINDTLIAGLNWNHQGAKIRHINDGETETATETYTYATGLAKDVLMSAVEDSLNGVVLMVMSDDLHVEGYGSFGWYLSQDNRATFETNTDSPAGAPSTSIGQVALPAGTDDLATVWNSGLTVNRLPQQLDLDVADTEQNLEVTSKANGLIFAFSGRVYYFPLYKGNIESEFGYEYRGGAVSKTETLSDGTDDEVYTLTGKQSNHTWFWETERFINLEGIDVGLKMKWTRESATTNASVDWESDFGADFDGNLTVSEKSVTHIWEFPVGAELAFKENWAFRAGVEHAISLNTTTTETKADDDVGDYENTDVTKDDTRSTSYKYGVGYAWSENLQLDINGFLVETPDAGAGERSDILDLSTYRNLAISATLTF